MFGTRIGADSRSVTRGNGCVDFPSSSRINSSDPAFAQGYRGKFELSIGESNGSIPDHVWIEAWQQFAREMNVDDS